MKNIFYITTLTVTVASSGSSISVPHRQNHSIDCSPGFSSTAEYLSKRASQDLGLPKDNLRTNCVSIGFLPSEGDAASPRYTMAEINEKLGAEASTYGWYAQITSSNFDGSQLLAVKEDVIASGAVFIASVMPSVNFNQITRDIANQVASVMKQFTDAGVTVWLRYAHEMNWYVTDGTYHGTSADFLASWKYMYNAACKDNSKVSCFWSPNQAERASDLQPWWPGEEYVDIVGIDCYPRSGDDTSSNELFDRFYKSFYDTYSKPYDLPFAIGETGAGPGQKEQWLETLVTQTSKYPNYISMSWFELDKEVDFRIVMTEDETLQQTQDILLVGGNDRCARGSDGTTPPVETSVALSATSTLTQSATPTSTAKATNSGAGCGWGCWGWDCSASVPCQTPWTCKGGYCK